MKKIKELLDIVLFGIDGFSNIVLTSLVNSNHSVKLVVCHDYDAEAFKQIKTTCESHDIPVMLVKTVNSPEVISRVVEAKPDICVIAHFERIIKKDLLSIPPMGFINIHPSLLPYYRGLAPQHWPIINGETETGITVHYVDEGTDTGDIILQKRIPLGEDMYVAELHSIWKELYATIVIEAIEHILSGQPCLSQPKGEGSFYAKMRSEPYPLEKEWSVRTAYNWVRAMSLPYDGVYYDDLIIYKAHIKTKDEKVDDEEPVLSFEDGALVADWYDEKE